MSVGQSDRSVPKHRTLDNLLGQTQGVLAKGKRPPGLSRRSLIIDRCAGDGTPNQFSGTSSPEIILKHAAWGWQNGLPTLVVLVEKDGFTCDRLAEFVDKWFSNHPEHEARRGDVTVVHSDGSDGSYIPADYPADGHVFINMDPNKMNDWIWTLDDGLLLVLSDHRFWIVFGTAGCNVGGSKRLPTEARKRWMETVKRLTRRVPPQLDVLVFRRPGDPSQWGYLLVAPVRWRDRLEKDIRKLFGREQSSPTLFGDEAQGLSMAWVRLDVEKFAAILRTLFFTKKELGEA